MLLRLRKEGKTLAWNRPAKASNYSPTTVRYGFLKMMRSGNKEDTEVKIPPALKTSAADCVEIARLLRKERKTWSEIGEREFPTWSHWTGLYGTRTA
jgi:hypothetical protein